MQSPVQNQKVRNQVAFALSGLMIITAAVSFFAGDQKAAAIIAGQAFVAFILVYNAAKRVGRRQA